MTHVLDYLKNNWTWLVPLLAFILANVANALTNHPQVKGVLLALSQVLDRFSVLAKKGAPDQTVKAPFVLSAWPEDHPLNPAMVPASDDTTSKGPKVIGALIWWVSLTAIGAGAAGITAASIAACGANAKEVATDVAKVCGEAGLSQAIAKLVPTVLGILMNGGNDWQAQLDGLAAPEAGVGIDAVVCAVQRSISDIENGVPKGAAMPPDKARAIQRGRIYSGLHKLTSSVAR